MLSPAHFSDLRKSRSHVLHEWWLPRTRGFGDAGRVADPNAADILIELRIDALVKKRIKIEHAGYCRKIAFKKKKTDRQGTHLPLLSNSETFLLAVPLWFRYLPGVHAGKCLGHVVQRHHMAMPGLRGMERLRESMKGCRFDRHGLDHDHRAGRFTSADKFSNMSF